MSMFEYKKTKKAIADTHDSVGRGLMSTQAMQVLMELELFGSSSLLDTDVFCEATLSGLLRDNGLRSIMFTDYPTLCYFLKLCVERSMLYLFLKYALDIEDTPSTITTITQLVEATSINVKFFDIMMTKAKEPFETLVANNLDWFPYFDTLPLRRSSDTTFISSSSRIPAPARGILNYIQFYSCTDGNMSNSSTATDAFKELGITVTAVIDLGDGRVLEFDIDSESIFFEQGSLNIYFFNSLTKDVSILIKDSEQAEMLYTEHNMFIALNYKLVSRGEF